MWALFLAGTMLDGVGEVLTELVDQPDLLSFTAAVVFVAFILLSSLTVMNMLIGVLVEVVSAVASVEKEQMEVSFVKNHLLHMMDYTGLDSDHDEQISKDEFEALLLKPEAARAL